MKLYVESINANNKGAELMLRAIVEHYEAAEPRPILVADPGYGTFERRARLGLRTKLPESLRPGKTSVALALLSQGFRDSYGMVDPAEIDVWLNAAGFKFTDQWGAEPTKEFVSRLKAWKRSGKKVILFPQAFGPFEDGHTRKAVKRLFELVDLAFARDEVSYAHLERAGVSLDRVRMAPDFTNLVKGELPDGYEWGETDVLIVPNERMTDMTSAGVRDAYLPFLQSAVSTVRRLRLRPKLLLHALSDAELVEPLRELVGDLDVVIEDDPIKLKGIIGTAQLLIGSRFHSLVSALSQGVPSIGVGWSHKYEELFSDYGCHEYLLGTDAHPDVIADRVGSLVTEPTRSEVMRVLDAAGDRLKKRVKEMWDEIDALIGIRTKPVTKAIGQRGQRKPAYV